MIGVDQAGLTECISFVYARLSEEERNAIMPNVFLCGGLSNMQGLVERLLHDVQMIAPYGSDVRVIKTNNPQIDSWKGLALISALSSTFSNDSISSVSQKYPVHNFGNAK
jgi:actin-related protein 5